MLKKAIFKIKGMSRDLAATAFNSQYAYENKNVRIMTTTEENTLLSLVNEKGTLKANLDITGFPIGQASLNNEVILFTTSKEFQDTNIVAETETINTINATEAQVNNINNYDRIYKLWVDNNTLKSNLLYEGYLNFSYKNPIETLPIYENNSIKKIYWVDGKNQPRFINIAKTYSNADNTTFDFIKNINLNHVIIVEANTQNSGQFNSGVIQYACSYFNIYGQQSNIFYESPLLYAAMNNRGGSPEEKSSNSFNISLSNLDTNFDYVRIYSIFRTSIDATPTVKVVGDFSTKSEINYTDTNTTGYIIDPTELFYIGGESIVAGTISQKDNTLFLGDIKINRPFIPKEIKDSLKTLNIVYYTNEYYSNSVRGYYQYKSDLNKTSYEITTFKSNEVYRFGIQFQYKTGKWSEVCFISDKEVDIHPYTKVKNNRNLLIGNIKAQVTLPEEIQNKLSSLGYIKARGVVVYPKESERNVVAQGVINSTLFYKEKEYLSSWFFRPLNKNVESSRISEEEEEKTFGSYPLEWRHYKEVNKFKKPSGSWEVGVDLGVLNNYYVNNNLVTFHSPDIEFSDINIDNLNFRIIGYIIIGGGATTHTVTTSTPPIIAEGGMEDDITIYTYNGENSSSDSYIPLSFTQYKDEIIKMEGLNPFNYYFLISPWQRSGSITNNPDNPTANTLEHNKYSNLMYSPYTVYNDVFWTPNWGISDIQIFNTDDNLLKIKTNYGSIKEEEIIYYGNYDKIVYSSDDNGNVYEGPVGYSNEYGKIFKSEYRKTNSPLNIKFKSSKHVIFSFDDDVIFPSPFGDALVPYNENYYKNISCKCDTDYTGSLSLVFPDNGILWLGELYRESVPNRFGGDDDNALNNNKWIVAGEATPLNMAINYLQGDTYIQRYDCLKTYPNSQDDVNNLTSILSFLCETRINIDGRYDRNRGNINNLAVSPENFNLLNNVYSQTNNFFSPNYTVEEDTKYTEFNNIVTWSKAKTLGEKVDTWTNITLASTLDLDGDKGPVRAIRRFNNNLVAFQDRGISQILYNESVQIASTNGVPIEIGNSGKVTGKRYISDKIGCMNKWSICETPSGIYFIDDTTKGIYLFDGKLDNLSDKLGFHSWINSRSEGLELWNPKDFKGFVTYYDKINGDVFFITDNECLAYSEPLKEFTSFYSYEHTPYFINIQDRGIFFRNTEDNNTSVWLHNEGKYNYYFDTYQPFYTTIIANPEAINDKTFSMVEFRADTWNNKTLLSTSFDNLEAWNEYQNTSSKLVTKLGVPSNLKRKFRIWRAQIPRDKSNNRDRMRNPWLYIKMEMKNPNENKTLLQDLTVVYF